MPKIRILFDPFAHHEPSRDARLRLMEKEIERAAVVHDCEDSIEELSVLARQQALEMGWTEEYGWGLPPTQ